MARPSIHGVRPLLCTCTRCAAHLPQGSFASSFAIFISALDAVANVPSRFTCSSSESLSLSLSLLLELLAFLLALLMALPLAFPLLFLSSSEDEDEELSLSLLLLLPPCTHARVMHGARARVCAGVKTRGCRCSGGPSRHSWRASAAVQRQ